MMTNIVTGRLSEAYKRRPRTVIALSAILVITLLVWAAVDTSPILSTEQVAAVKAFAIRTDSADVRMQFNKSVEDGRLTLNETKSIVEVAKHQEAGYGLISDDKNSK